MILSRSRSGPNLNLDCKLALEGVIRFVYRSTCFIAQELQIQGVDLNSSSMALLSRYIMHNK